jgi:hypothetical protein
MRLMLPSVASQTKKISLLFLLRRGVWGEPAKNERKFYGFVSAASYIEIYHNIV